jgi:YggT family protein
MLVDIARLILDIAAALLGSLLVLRAYMGWLGMPGRNPLAQFTFALTQWIVGPLSRLLPRRGRMDWASLAAAALLATLVALLLQLLRGRSADMAGLSLTAAMLMLSWSLNLAMWLTILYAILSWVNPQAPIAPALAMLVRPFLVPIQRVLPSVGGVDLSPIVLIVLINVALMVLSRLGI